MVTSVQLDVESLRTLIAVVEAGGMTRAAERLHLTQSAVSWKIKRLEARVGRPLLIRDGHTIRPSREGRVLLDDARELVAIHDRAVGRLVGSELTGSVMVGCNEELDAAQMAAVLGNFRRRHPLTSVEFRVDHTEQLVAAVDDGDIDVAVVQVLDSDRRASDTVLWSDPLQWFVGAEHVDSFEDGPIGLVTFGPHCFYRAVSEPLLDAAGLEHRVACSTNSLRGVHGAIAAGLGVGVIGSRYATSDVVVWPRSRSLPELPVVHTVVRTVPGEAADAASVLAAAITDEVTAPELPISA